MSFQLNSLSVIPYTHQIPEVLDRYLVQSVSSELELKELTELICLIRKEDFNGELGKEFTRNITWGIRNICKG